jgi:hypothetical protein
MLGFMALRPTTWRPPETLNWTEPVNSAPLCACRKGALWMTSIKAKPCKMAALAVCCDVKWELLTLRLLQSFLPSIYFCFFIVLSLVYHYLLTSHLILVSLFIFSYTFFVYSVPLLVFFRFIVEGKARWIFNGSTFLCYVLRSIFCKHLQMVSRVVSMYSWNQLFQKIFGPLTQPQCPLPYLSVCCSTVILLDLGRFFSFLILYTVGRNPKISSVFQNLSWIMRGLQEAIL